MLVNVSELALNEGTFTITSTTSSKSPKVKLFLLGFWEDSGMEDSIPILSGARNVRLEDGQNLTSFDSCFVKRVDGFPIITGIFNSEETAVSFAKPKGKGKGKATPDVSPATPDENIPY